MLNGTALKSSHSLKSWASRHKKDIHSVTWGSMIFPSLISSGSSAEKKGCALCWSNSCDSGVLTGLQGQAGHLLLQPTSSCCLLAAEKEGFQPCLFRFTPGAQTQWGLRRKHFDTSAMFAAEVVISIKKSEYIPLFSHYWALADDCWVACL